MGTISVDDLMESSNDGAAQSSENNNSGADDDGALETAVDEVGGNLESAREYVDNNGKKDDLTEFAQELARDEELHALQEEYRRMNDLKRIITNYLYNDDREYSHFLDSFWGDSDDPTEGTYNYVQQQSRDEGGNLAFYKALFPEPVEAYWDDDVVLWQERPDDDSHIYITRSFVEEYGGFTIEVDGSEKPRPPSDAELKELSDGGSGGSTPPSDSSAPFDPGEMTVDALREALGDQPGDTFTVAELEALLEAEKSGDGKHGNRKLAKKAIRGALNQARDASDDEPEQQSLDESAKDPEAVAGEIIGENGLDMSVAAIAGMLKGGMSREDIEQRFA